MALRDVLRLYAFATVLGVGLIGTAGCNSMADPAARLSEFESNLATVERGTSLEDAVDRLGRPSGENGGAKYLEFLLANKDKQGLQVDERKLGDEDEPRKGEVIASIYYMFEHIAIGGFGQRLFVINFDERGAYSVSTIIAPIDSIQENVLRKKQGG